MLFFRGDAGAMVCYFDDRPIGLAFSLEFNLVSRLGKLGRIGD